MLEKVQAFTHQATIKPCTSGAQMKMQVNMEKSSFIRIFHLRHVIIPKSNQRKSSQLNDSLRSLKCDQSMIPSCWSLPTTIPVAMPSSLANVLISCSVKEERVTKSLHRLGGISRLAAHRWASNSMSAPQPLLRLSPPQRALPFA